MKTTTVTDGAGTILGYVFTRGFDEPKPSGVDFLTPPGSPQQVALISHPRRHRVAAHGHHPLFRETVGTPETLVVLKGGCVLRFYTPDGVHLASHVLGPGDVAVLLAGGHDLEAGEHGVELVEVKQGPYLGAENDKYTITVPR